jgi:hypothetical protein
VLTAVFWQSPPDFPHAFFEAPGPARSWALEETLKLDVRESRSLGDQQKKARAQRGK